MEVKATLQNVGIIILCGCLLGALYLFPFPYSSSPHDLPPSAPHSSLHPSLPAHLTNHHVLVSSNSAPRKKVAFCVTGQLGRLELESKVKNIFLANAEEYSVTVVMSLGSGPPRFNSQGDLWAPSPYSHFSPQQLVSAIHHLHDTYALNNNSNNKEGKTEEYVGKKFKVEVEVYDYRELEDGTWDKWLETNPSLCLSPDCSPFTAAHFGHYASVSRCMRTLEQVELQRGEKFDTVVRLREDTYALGEWKLTRDYDKTLTTLGLFSFGGLCDITYVVSREFASQLLHGLLDFRLPHKIFTLPDDLRYPPNSENWLANVVSFLNIPTRPICH